MALYNLKYEYDENDKEEISIFLNKLRNNSEQQYINQSERGLIPKNRENLAKFNFIFECVEDYLYYYYINDKDSYSEVLSQLKTNMTSITVMDSSHFARFGGVYGFCDDNNIFINPRIVASRDLTDKERTRLYVFHELKHRNNKAWINKAQNFFNSEISEYYSFQERQTMFDGLGLLDEVSAQYTAEKMAYFFAKKKIPQRFDYYEGLKKYAISFMKTMRGIGRIDDYNQNGALEMMEIRTKKEGFFDDVLDEYVRDNQIRNLFIQLYDMGIIRNAAYARIGQKEQSYLDREKGASQRLLTISSRLRDYREPLPKAK